MFACLTVIFLCILLSLPSIVFSETALEPKCSDVKQLMQYASKGMGQDKIGISLRKGPEAHYFLMVSALDKTNPMDNDKVRLRMPWRLLKRTGNSTNHCIVGAGEFVEILLSVHDAPTPEKRYGMPGSGYPRCTDYGEDKTSIMIWANKELGKSTRTVHTSDIIDKSFMVLITPDGYWTILDSNRDFTASMCYYDRGDNLIQIQY